MTPKAVILKLPLLPPLAPTMSANAEFTLSSGEAFTMMLQDAGRAKVLGMRTDGGGGNPGAYNATTYSEGIARVTRTFVTRANLVSTPNFPPANHMENVGVYPDILVDYMTRENFDTFGGPFVDAFTSAIVDMIAQGKDTIRIVNDRFEATGKVWNYAHKEEKVSIAGNVRVILHTQLKDILK